jgi:hypothetical protein
MNPDHFYWEVWHENKKWGCKDLGSFVPIHSWKSRRPRRLSKQ